MRYESTARPVSASSLDDHAYLHAPEGSLVVRVNCPDEQVQLAFYERVPTGREELRERCTITYLDTLYEIKGSEGMREIRVMPPALTIWRPQLREIVTSMRDAISEDLGTAVLRELE